jgi:hypothetical protein
MTTNKGIDYSLGSSNFNPITGIHFGVISQNSINLDYTSDFEQEYGNPFCPKCGAENIPPSEDSADEDWNDGKDYACVNCEECFWSDQCTPDESIGWNYTRDGYKLTDCLDNDIFVLESPFYTFTQFCSPCVPGAGNLDTPVEDGAKTYCLGHDWFEDGSAPYPVYDVATNELVAGADKPFRCDQCEALMINGNFCHETGCPNERKTWEAERGEWVHYVTCFNCDDQVELGTTCDCDSAESEENS